MEILLRKIKIYLISGSNVKSKKLFFNRGVAMNFFDSNKFFFNRRNFSLDVVSIWSFIFIICLCLGKCIYNLEEIHHSDNQLSEKDLGKAEFRRTGSVSRRALLGTIVDVRILLSFVLGTCTYRLALPRLSFHDCTALVTPVSHWWTRGPEMCRAARWYARHGNCVEAGNDSVRTNYERSKRGE